jgi:hypothetical protein
MKKDTKDGSGLTVGVDPGDRWSRYCVLDPDGEILEEDTIASTGKAFRKLFGKRPAARVVIEVGTHSPWVQRLLQELGHETITANPRSSIVVEPPRPIVLCSEVAMPWLNVAPSWSITLAAWSSRSAGDCQPARRRPFTNAYAKIYPSS